MHTQTGGGQAMPVRPGFVMVLTHQPLGYCARLPPIGQARIRHRDMGLVAHLAGTATGVHAPTSVSPINGRVRLNELRHGGVLKALVGRRACATARLGHRHHVDLRPVKAVQQRLPIKLGAVEMLAALKHGVQAQLAARRSSFPAKASPSSGTLFFPMWPPATSLVEQPSTAAPGFRPAAFAR